VELETDKAAQEIPAPVAGTVVKIAANTGDTVEPGNLLCQIDASRRRRGPGTGCLSAGSNLPPGRRPVRPCRRHRRPQKMMAEKNLSADQVAGSGKRGQVLKGDVIAAAQSGISTHRLRRPGDGPWSGRAEDEAREERVRMTKLRQTIARRLKDAQNTAAMLTTYNEVDMGPVMELRKQYKDLFEKKHGVKLGFMGFFTKAVRAHALQEVPAVNAEIDGTDIIYKNFCHIGVAVGTPKGLVVPVVRDCRPDVLRRDRGKSATISAKRRGTASWAWLI
jgi:2-oxoglutarate dehydrogenase E2 component (dihydrolipoamide succinyltransferase)